MGKSTLSAYDNSVSLVRLTGMVCILLCHLFAWIGIAALSQLFNVGVPLFLLISGFLYGGKPVKPRSFLANRYLRVTLPVGIFILLLSVFLFFSARESASFGTIPLYMLNLQGLNFLCGYIPYWELCGGTGHLWFITVLMLCYLLMLALKRIENRLHPSGHALLVTLIVSCAAVALLCMVKIYISYLQIFFIGYVCKKRAWESRFKPWLLWTGLMIVAVGARLLLVQRGMDDAEWYLSVVALQQNLLAFWIFATFRLVYARRPAWFDAVAQNKLIRHADSLSFYVYIVHYMFLVDPFNVSQLGIRRIYELVIFAIATVVCAEALRGVTILAQKAIRLPIRKTSVQT